MKLGFCRLGFRVCSVRHVWYVTKRPSKEEAAEGDQSPLERETLYVRSTNRSVKLRRNLAIEKKYVFIIKDMDILSKALMKFYGTEFHKVRNCPVSSKSLLEWVLISLILFYSLSSGLESF